MKQKLLLAVLLSTCAIASADTRPKIDTPMASQADLIASCKHNDVYLEAKCIEVRQARQLYRTGLSQAAMAGILNAREAELTRLKTENELLKMQILVLRGGK